MERLPIKLEYLPVLFLMSPAIGPGAELGVPFEAERKIERIGVTDIPSNLRDGLVGEPEKLLRAVQSLDFQKLLRCFMDLPPEKAGKPGHRKSAVPGEFIQGNRVGKIPAKVFQGLADPRIKNGAHRFWIGGITQQNDLFKRVHGKILPVSNRAARMHDSLQKISPDACLRGPVRYGDLHQAGCHLRPVKPFMPARVRQEVSPEPVPVTGIPSHAVVMRRARLNQDGVSPGGGNVPRGMTEPACAGHGINQQPAFGSTRPPCGERFAGTKNPKSQLTPGWSFCLIAGHNSKILYVLNKPVNGDRPGHLLPSNPSLMKLKNAGSKNEKGDSVMSPRERVLRAFKQIPGLPDRVPVQFDLCRSLLEHFGQKLNIPVHYTKNLFEDVTYRISGNEIRTAMGCDVVAVGASESAGFQTVMDQDGSWLNEYGMRMRQGTLYVDIVDNPLAHAETKADIDAYSFPDPDALGRYEDAESLVRQFHDRYVVIGDIEVTIFALARHLVGMEKLMMDMACREDYIAPLLEACAEFQTQIGLRLIERGVDAIWLGDDFGSQNGLLLSQTMFKEMLMPHYQRMIDRFRAANPRILPILHSDGAVAQLLPLFHEMGIRGFNPVQPGVPGHSPKEIKDGFGEQFAFWGAIDQQHLLPNGTDEELEEDIRSKIGILGKGGGYMIAPAHIIQADVSPERVELFITVCRRLGVYS
ncbi:MAG: uroporphyrinogen decarboxylase family protein [Verrucomicrobiota bacterium]